MRTNYIIPTVAALLACGGSAATSPSETGGSTTSGEVPPMYKAFTGGGMSVKIDGGSVVITTTGVPDHKSPYFGTGNAKYEAYNGANRSFQLNPNVIQSQQLSFRIPIAPTRLTTPSPTPLGPIGVATNG